MAMTSKKDGVIEIMVTTIDLERAKEQIQKLLDLSEDDHNNMIIDRAHDYTAHNFRTNWTKSESFWHWWFKQWAMTNWTIMQDPFFKHCLECSKLSSVQKDILWKGFRGSHDMLFNIHPSNGMREQIRKEAGIKNYNYKLKDTV
jgi:hypothetical protein